MKPLQGLPQIIVDGIPISQSLRLAQLRVVQRLDAPSQCQISWRTATMDMCALAASSIGPGASLSVRIEEEPQVMFTGEVTAVEHVHQPSGEFLLRVRAYDALARLQRRQTLTTHVDVNTAELTRVLAEAVGITVTAQATGPIWSRVMPRFKHDLALLRYYAGRSGLHFILERDALHLFALGGEAGQPLDLSLGDNLFEARVEHNAVQPVAEVQVFGWDSHTGGDRVGQSREENASGALPGDSNAQPGMNEPGSNQKLGSKTRSLFGLLAESDSETEALARAELEGNQLASLVVSGVAEGSPALGPGRSIQLDGVAAEMAGPHTLTVVTHTIDADGGYLSEFSSQPEPLDRPPAVPSLVLGEVCDIDDPEQRGRVQVTLASFGAAASNWMLVMQAGAGEGKGWVSLPEVGDQVVVALPDSDPARGLVLGGIYGADGPPHERGQTGAGQHHPYTLATRGGQRIHLNDSDGSIRLENASGSFLSLTPDGIELHASGDMALAAPGQGLRLVSHRIDLDRG